MRRSLPVLASLLLFHCASGRLRVAEQPRPSPVTAPGVKGVFLVNLGDDFSAVVSAAHDGGLLAALVFQDSPKVLDPNAAHAEFHPTPVDHQVAIARLRADGGTEWIRPLAFTPAQLMSPWQHRDADLDVGEVRDELDGLWALAAVGDRSALIHLGADGDARPHLVAAGRYSRMQQLVFDGDALYLAGQFSGELRLGDAPRISTTGSAKDGGPPLAAFVARVRRDDLHVEWVRAIAATGVERVLRAELTGEHRLSVLVSDHAPGDVVRLPGLAAIQLGDGTWSVTFSAVFGASFDAQGTPLGLTLWPLPPVGTGRECVTRDANGDDIWFTVHCKAAGGCVTADEWLDVAGKPLRSLQPGITGDGTLASLAVEEKGVLLLRTYGADRRLQIRRIHALRGLPNPSVIGHVLPVEGGWVVAVQLHEGWASNNHAESGLLFLPKDWDGVLELARKPWRGP